MNSWSSCLQGLLSAEVNSILPAELYPKPSPTLYYLWGADGQPGTL